MLLSCEDNTQALMEINADRQDPLGVATNIRMVYSDSLKNTGYFESSQARRLFKSRI